MEGGHSRDNVPRAKGFVAVQHYEECPSNILRALNNLQSDCRAGLESKWLGQHAERSGTIAASERREIVNRFVLQLSARGTVKDAEEK